MGVNTHFEGENGVTLTVPDGSVVLSFWKLAINEQRT